MKTTKLDQAIALIRDPAMQSAARRELREMRALIEALTMERDLAYAESEALCEAGDRQIERAERAERRADRYKKALRDFETKYIPTDKA